MSDKYYLSKYKIEHSPREFRVELHGYNTGSEVIEPPKLINQLQIANA